MNHLPADSDPWDFLQMHTPARIARGRTGHSLPTDALLSFQLDHAQARDAVYSGLNTTQLTSSLQQIHPDVRLLHSQVRDRRHYLQRPDLGRRLNSESHKHLERGELPFDLSLVIADGLSATAINRHAMPVVTLLVEETRKMGWTLAPICLVEQGRVAVADEVADALGAEIVLLLIGERPGLSSPDSMGAYLTYGPRPGLTDETRNCISNIRSEGLPYATAVHKLLYLLTEMKSRRLSGVQLKDESTVLIPNNFN